ncbi:MAG: phosphoribosyl-AMP cyclohydrolase [Erythrobacter sp.]|uniref:phosphoribosyl-AMP cyclohydrolase n=1 Tax=Erythrobacter sp. TaxID=1042 RepID=UPI0032EF2A02
MDRTSIAQEELEQGSRFAPRFDEAGLMPAIVVDADSGDVLVLAWMNAEALERTRTSGRVTFWSRSRGRLWTKGETSGNFLEVEEMLVDCDQDALLIRSRPHGPTCHTGARSCFYRRIDPAAEDGNALSPSQG